MTQQGDRGGRAGWYPDPTGRFEFRYHNGATWTADVASGGQRYVDRLDHTTVTTATATVTPRNGVATAALTCGIVGAAVGWLPVVFVAGYVLAVLAIVFGIVGLSRARRSGVGRGFAITGLVTGVVGLLSSTAGLALTVVTYWAIERYEEPAPNVVEIVRCEVSQGRVDVEGTLRNLDDETASFTVLVTVERARSGVEIGSVRVRLDDVAPDETVTFAFDRSVSTDSVDCVVDEVTGPLPFGIVPS